jgi:hypothetical protein
MVFDYVMIFRVADESRVTLKQILQIVVFPLFVEGPLSPADDTLDFAIAAVLVQLLSLHWEFLPSFLAKLVVGVDLVPFWTMAVATSIGNRSGSRSP